MKLNKLIYIVIILCFSFTLFSCNKGSEDVEKEDIDFIVNNKTTDSYYEKIDTIYTDNRKLYDVAVNKDDSYVLCVYSNIEGDVKYQLSLEQYYGMIENKEYTFEDQIKFVKYNSLDDVKKKYDSFELRDVYVVYSATINKDFLSGEEYNIKTKYYDYYTEKYREGMNDNSSVYDHFITYLDLPKKDYKISSFLDVTFYEVYNNEYVLFDEYETYANGRKINLLNQTLKEVKDSSNKVIVDLYEVFKDDIVNNEEYSITRVYDSKVKNTITRVGIKQDVFVSKILETLQN